MKLIIDIDDKDFELINKTGITIDLNTAFHGKEKDKEMTFAIFNLVKALKNGTPYNPSADCISREALKEHKVYSEERHEYVVPVYNIDNAQAIPLPNEQTAWEQGYEAGLAQGNHDRPKGEWETDNIGIYCSVCKRHLDNKTPFCPLCGADMRGGEQKNENKF